jgi:ABC-2 type transport system permease protein
MSIFSSKNMVALQTILRKEIIRFMRIWSQTLLPPAITMTLYFIIFGKLIGAQLHEIQGHTYMQYIVPGLTMMSIMTSAYANTASSFFGAKFSKSIEEMLVSSMPNYVILLGYMLGGALRGLLVGAIVMCIGFMFTHIPIHSIWVVLSMAILSSMLFSIGGLLNGIFAKKFDDVSFIPTFVLTPLTYLGGVFYSIQQLPAWWQTLSLFNPIMNIVSTFKFGMLGTTDINTSVGFLMVCLLLVALFIWCLYLLEKGIGLRT